MFTKQTPYFKLGIYNKMDAPYPNEDWTVDFAAIDTEMNSNGTLANRILQRANEIIARVAQILSINVNMREQLTLAEAKFHEQDGNATTAVTVATNAATLANTALKNANDATDNVNKSVALVVQTQQANNNVAISISGLDQRISALENA